MKLTKELLEREYLENRKSCRQIGDEFGFSKTGVRTYLRKFDIPRRTLKEARTLLPVQKIKGTESPFWKGGPVTVLCATCGKDITVYPYRLEITKNFFCDAKCKGDWQRVNCKGEKSAHWKGGTWVGTSHMRGWTVLRREILERDGHCCKVCGSTEILSVHHIVRRADRPDLSTEPSNLITLCRACHVAVHKKRVKQMTLFSVMVAKPVNCWEIPQG